MARTQQCEIIPYMTTGPNPDDYILYWDKDFLRKSNEGIHA
ncbi:hypothetical protein PSAB6_360102 [Paraburkholderia sabiae]|nr:hypothetical protein PSAB6_360102 [Paraburkholderia sabiae]